MPILIKKLDGSIVSKFDPTGSDYVGDVILIKSVVGEIGLEDYFSLTAIEGLVQNLSRANDSEFCETTPTTFGPNGCETFEDLTVSL